MAIRQDASTGQLVDDGLATAASTTGPTIRVRIYSPFRTYFNDVAYSISAASTTGPFDILPGHHNFMSLLTPCEVTVRTPLGERHIRISGGLLHVKADLIKIFLDV